MISTKALVLTASTCALLSSSLCCCLPSSIFPTPATDADAPGIERAANAYGREHAEALLGPPPPDAGPDARCSAGSIVFAVGVATVSNGHVGGEPAAEVSYALEGCLRRVVMYVVRQAAGWVVVGAVVWERANGGYEESEVLRLGTPPAFVVYPDSDYGSGELF